MKLKLPERGENSLRISYSLQKNQNDYIKKGKLRETRNMRGKVRNITRSLWKSLRDKTWAHAGEYFLKKTECEDLEWIRLAQDKNYGYEVASCINGVQFT